ncbi:metal ABC transporter solute-binding protein, Zn/Mn family [Roseinatronobacter sp. NSM]|uniref:metal ABC transporter solute-binding protein, Zn/Mn family n=1 Tax=Roseinatronobacter sp. NSM TaxID=3457785 RepID=UPI004035396F
MHRPVAFATTLALALGLGPRAMAEDAPLNVLATIGMIADVAQNVAGPCATVSTLIGAGTDPHDYSATPRDVQALASAELIFYVDAALEERLAGVLQNFADRTPTIGLVAATFDSADLLADPDAPGTLDPHLWMDVSRWMKIAPVIADEITRLRPACQQGIQDNLAQYTAQLDALHDWVEETIATIPVQQRMLVTAHDAFAYYSNAYGIEASEAIEGLSTTSEASIGDIRNVAAFVVENSVPAVFVETTLNPRTIDALIAEAQSLGHDVTLGGALYSDAMGDVGTAEGTYIGMIRHNTATIAHALGGTVPPLPDLLRDWAETWDMAQ